MTIGLTTGQSTQLDQMPKLQQKRCASGKKKDVQLFTFDNGIAVAGILGTFMHFTKGESRQTILQTTGKHSKNLHFSSSQQDYSLLLHQKHFWAQFSAACFSFFGNMLSIICRSKCNSNNHFCNQKKTVLGRRSVERI